MGSGIAPLILNLGISWDKSSALSPGIENKVVTGKLASWVPDPVWPAWRRDGTLVPAENGAAILRTLSH